MEVVLRCKNHVRVDALTVVDFTTLLACAAGGNWVGVLYCFGSGAARRVGIQVNLKIPRGFATRFAWHPRRPRGRLSLVPTICPWVSEDVRVAARPPKKVVPRTHSRCASRDSTNQNASFVD